MTQTDNRVPRMAERTVTVRAFQYGAFQYGAVSGTFRSTTGATVRLH